MNQSSSFDSREPAMVPPTMVLGNLICNSLRREDSDLFTSSCSYRLLQILHSTPLGEKGREQTKGGVFLFN